MSVIIDLSVFPMDKGGASVSPYVARVLRVIRESGLPHVLGPMGTCVEGEWEEVLAVVDACHRELADDCDRVYMTVKVDSRKGRVGGLKSKTRSAVDKADAAEGA